MATEAVPGWVASQRERLGAAITEAERNGQLSPLRPRGG